MTNEIITEAQVTALVGQRVKELGTVALAAKAWNTSPQMVHMVQKGNRRPTPEMLDDLGLERSPAVLSYRKKQK